MLKDDQVAQRIRLIGGAGLVACLHRLHQIPSTTGRRGLACAGMCVAIWAYRKSFVGRFVLRISKQSSYALLAAEPAPTALTLRVLVLLRIDFFAAACDFATDSDASLVFFCFFVSQGSTQVRLVIPGASGGCTHAAYAIGGVRGSQWEFTSAGRFIAPLLFKMQFSKYTFVIGQSSKRATSVTTRIGTASRYRPGSGIITSGLPLCISSI